MNGYNGWDPQVTMGPMGSVAGAAIQAQGSGGFAPVASNPVPALQGALNGKYQFPGADPGGTGSGFGISGMSQGTANNLGYASMGLGALQTVGSLWNSYNANKLAKKSYGLQKKAFETNLKASTKSYNTALEDRIRSRYATEGRSGEADAYIDKNKL